MRISDWSSDVCSSDLKPRIMAILTSASRGLAHNRVAFELLPGSSIADSDAAAAAGNLDFIRYFRAKGFDCSYKGAALAAVGDRKSAVEGKSVYVSVDLGGRRIIKQKQKKKNRD